MKHAILEGHLYMRLHIGGKHINIENNLNVDWAGDADSPPNTFSLLEKGPYRGVGNDKKWWHNLQ